MHKIDDNLLAAYLEGNLNAAEAEMVEQAIDADKDLQAIVDEWVNIQDNLIAQKVKANITSREAHKVCSGNEGVYHSPVTFDTGGASRKKNRQKKNWRYVVMAASMLVLVGLGVFWILQNSNDMDYNIEEVNYKLEYDNQHNIQYYKSDSSDLISIESDTIIVDTPEDSIKVMSEYEDYPVHIIVKKH